MADFNFGNFIASGGLTGALGAVGGVADLIGTKKRMQGFESDLSAAESAQEDFFKQYEAGAFDPVVSQAQRDLMQAAKRKTDTSQILANQATSVESAMSDPRMAAALITNIQRGTNEALMAQQQADTHRSLSAQQNYATVSDAALNKKRDFDRELGLMGLAEAKRAEEMSRQNIMNEKNARRSAIADIIGGAIGAGVGVGAAKQDTPLPPSLYGYGQQRPLTAQELGLMGIK